MVQSEVEVVKLTSLFQKVLYKWLEGQRFSQFGVGDDTTSYVLSINKSFLSIVTYRENKLQNLGIYLRLTGTCPPYGYWVNEVAEYNITSSVRFYSRGKVQFEFLRANLDTNSSNWYSYVTEILSQLNESQRFSLEVALRDVLTELDTEIEFREGCL